MTTVFDVANFYLAKESMTPKKLQKIVYYAYGWTIAFMNDSVDDIMFKLFENRIEAWVHGPVVPDLYHYYKDYGWQSIQKQEGYTGPEFSSDVEDILNQVWEVYGDLTANQLEMISHKEAPWINARIGLAPYETTTNLISDKDMFIFFNEQATCDE